MNHSLMLKDLAHLNSMLGDSSRASITTDGENYSLSYWHRGQPAHVVVVANEGAGRVWNHIRENINALRDEGIA